MRASHVLFLVLVFVWLYSTAFARTWHVKAHGRADAPTIQAAIDSARNGDTVILANGTYTGDGNRDIDFHGETITVRSRSDNPRVCIIDCQGSELEPHRGFYFHSGEGMASVLRGLSVTNRYAPLTEVPVVEFDPEILGKVLSLPSTDSRAAERWKNVMSSTPARNRTAFGVGRANAGVGDDETKPIRIIIPESPTSLDSGPVGGASVSSSRPLQKLLRLLEDGTLPAAKATSRVKFRWIGGGIFCEGYEDTPIRPAFARCSFVANSATVGGEVYGSWGTTTSVHCSFLENTDNGVDAFDMGGWAVLKISIGSTVILASNRFSVTPITETLVSSQHLRAFRPTTRAACSSAPMV